MRSIHFGSAFAGLLLMTAAAAAQAPAAIVEDVTDKNAGVEFMDYVTPGKVIKLSTGKIVLGYLKSCLREVISGGTVTIGDEQSEVQGGSAERIKVACEAAKMNRTAAIASQTAASSFRAAPPTKPIPLSQLRPNFTLYGTAPLVEVAKGGTVVIERVDKLGERYEITDTGPLVRGAYYDFAADNKALATAGVYRISYPISSGTAQMLFQVDPDALPGRSPTTGRLIRLQAAN